MTQRSGREPDRRQHRRIEAKGSVTLYALGNAHRGRLTDIAAGGMSVATEIVVPDGVLGSVVDLELRFDGPLGAWQRLTGRVSRIDGQGFAVAFDAPRAPALLRILEELDSASDASARVISVVLIDADAGRRTAVATGFRVTGCKVVEAPTPLEAIVRLGESRFEPDVIALANPQTGSADEMRAFIQREHPNSMLVTIGHELLDPAGLANWLSSAASTVDLPGRIRGLLFGARAR